MSKGSKGKNDGNPFGSFKLLKGQFVEPEEGSETVEIDTSTNIVEDKVEDTELSASEKKRMEAADKALEALAEAKSKKTTAKTTVEVEEVEEEPSTTEEEEDDDEPTSVFKVFVKDLHDKGVIDFDDNDEDFEDSEDGLAKLTSKTVENRIHKTLEETHPDLPVFMQYLRDGGDPKDFYQAYYGNHSWDNIDLNDEDNQKLVALQALKLAGESEEDAQDIVNEWYDNGTLAKRAKTSQAKLVKYTEAEKERLVKEQAIEAEKQRKANEKYWNDLKEDLMKKEELLGFKLTPKMREDLWNFTTTPDRKTGKTAYQEAIEKQKDAQWLFALQAMTGFDKSKLEVQARTKASSKMADLLRNGEKTSKDKISRGATDTNYGTDPFEAFRNSR